eukprot:scaffold40713_cov260-Amphora_coffeaeformis.AAC.1
MSNPTRISLSIEGVSNVPITADQMSRLSNTAGGIVHVPSGLEGPEHHLELLDNPRNLAESTDIIQGDVSTNRDMFGSSLI